MTEVAATGRSTIPYSITMAREVRTGVAGGIIGCIEACYGIKSNVVSPIDVLARSVASSIVADPAQKTLAIHMARMLTNLGSNIGPAQVTSAQRSRRHAVGTAPVAAAARHSGLSIKPLRRAGPMAINLRTTQAIVLEQRRTSGSGITTGRATLILTRGAGDSRQNDIEADIDIATVGHLTTRGGSDVTGITTVTLGIGMQIMLASRGATGSCRIIESVRSA